MRILICDDEQDIVDKIQKYVIDFFKQQKLKIPIIQSYNTGEDLLSDSGKKDIIFLDVKLPGLNGIYVGRELKKENKNALILIITSYVEYLDDAMRFHVFRYLIKPIEKQRLFQNMKDAIQSYNAANIKIPIETKEGVYISTASDIIFIEAQNHIVTVYTPNKSFITTHKLAHWIKTLNMPCFFQTHRSFIINMKYVTDFDHSLIHLYNGQYSAYLTKRKYSQFKEAYLLYLESTR